jgi:hypothetical protein
MNLYVVSEQEWLPLENQTSAMKRNIGIGGPRKVRKNRSKTRRGVRSRRLKLKN